MIQNSFTFNFKFWMLKVVIGWIIHNFLSYIQIIIIILILFIIWLMFATFDLKFSIQFYNEDFNLPFVFHLSMSIVLCIVFYWFLDYFSYAKNVYKCLFWLFNVPGCFLLFVMKKLHFGFLGYFLCFFLKCFVILGCSTFIRTQFLKELLNFN